MDSDADSSYARAPVGAPPTRWQSFKDSVASRWAALVKFLNEQSRATLVKSALIVVLVVALVVGALVAVKLGAARAFLTWVESLGLWGMLVMVAAFIVASLPVPLVFGLLTVSSGFLFKLWAGLATTMVGCAIGSLLVFLGARFVFRAKVEQMIAANAFFLKFNGRIEREGWKLAIVMRLASVPFGFVNVFLAVTKLSFEAFVLTTVAGEAPIAFIGCFIGSTLHSLSEATDGGGAWTPTRIALFVTEATLALTFVVVALLISRRMVRQSLDEAAADHPLAEERSSDAELQPIDGRGSSGGLTEVLVHERTAPSEELEPLRLRRSRSNSPKKGPPDNRSDFGTL